jgi:hypothetical protein
MTYDWENCANRHLLAAKWIQHDAAIETKEKNIANLTILLKNMAREVEQEEFNGDRFRLRRSRPEALDFSGAFITPLQE